ncbi:hypothetical protein AVEN_111550-1 [Araneus ventricosus]|uniref:Reverse transcriptase domain-containing protein n=1 Tax=Araneus ventricosus TaxID=182803 RepID=A0A4Y2WB34_ARAVE|nr:hypothetical protein AVEN_111550-1 [Araneus ventricosus]
MKKNTNQPGSYSSFSLLYSLIDIAEQLNLNMPSELFQVEFFPYRFGFHKNVSIGGQILRITIGIRQRFSTGLVIDAVLMDIAKVFDRVWIVGLINKCSN